MYLSLSTKQYIHLQVSMYAYVYAVNPAYCDTTVDLCMQARELIRVV